MKIIIADDSAFMRSILKDIISKTKWADAQIVEAVDGSDALSKFQTEQPDMMLLDVVMPKEDGLGVLKQLGGGARSVIIVSSVDQPDMIEAAKLLGVREYVTKPFDAVQVVALLNSLELAPDGGLTRGSDQ